MGIKPTAVRTMQQSFCRFTSKLLTVIMIQIILCFIDKKNKAWYVSRSMAACHEKTSHVYSSPASCEETVEKARAGQKDGSLEL